MVPNFLVPEDAQFAAKKNPTVHRLSPVAPGKEPFKEALLEKAFAAHKRTPLDWVASMAVHGAIVAAIVIFPLYFSQSLDLANFQATYLVNPAPPLAPSPPPPPAAAAARPHPVTPPHPNALIARLREPIAIPNTVEKPLVAQEEAPPSVASAGVPGGVVGGVPGGVLGGVLGGVVGSGSSQPAPPPAPVAAAPSGPLRVGGQVKPPRLIYRAPPEYPVLAKTARVQGTVDIEAVIDENGNVVKAHAMDGPALLIEAALKAVTQWKYEPTYLNGKPYPVDLTIQVSFNLS